jgi:hypothetical protein
MIAAGSGSGTQVKHKQEADMDITSRNPRTRHPRRWLLRGVGAAIVAAALLPPALAAGAATTGGAACAPSSLAVKFVFIPGSPGAGTQEYTLTVTNHGHAACTIGKLGITLIGATGTKLPTHAMTSSHSVTLNGGASAKAVVRFSGDVAGTGETTTGPCEATAHTMRVTFAGTKGVVTAPISPPTPFCEKGSIGVPALHS